MGCQKWLHLCAPIFSTYFWRFRWCEITLTRRSFEEKNHYILCIVLWFLKFHIEIDFFEQFWAFQRYMHLAEITGEQCTLLVLSRLEWILNLEFCLLKLLIFYQKLLWTIRSRFKVRIFWEGPKILWNLYLTVCTVVKSYVKISRNFCGLLRIYEL